MAECREKCGIFGIYAPNCDVAHITHAALWSLQHRGQEGTGIVVTDGSAYFAKKGSGLVTEVYTQADLDSLKGHCAVGHNRYATSGGGGSEHLQPVLRPNKLVALAHNGNLPDISSLAHFLNSLGVETRTSNDSELIADGIAYFIANGNSLVQAVKKIFPHLVGAFSIVACTKDSLVAFRDAYGIRPLCIGKISTGKNNTGYVFSSEDCVFPNIGATFERSVDPGELVCITRKGMRSYQLAKGSSKFDIFEFVYFARADSSFMGKRVNEVRRNFGKQLALEAPVPTADLIVAVPDSAFPAAEGFSEVSGLLVKNGFIKNGYVHRTFISPGQLAREKYLHMKLNPIPEVVAGKSIVLVDDSLVRGTTTKQLVKLLRAAGAREVHVRISSPPVLYPDFYGIDTPSQSELLAACKSRLQIQKFIAADSLEYLSYAGMIAATELPESVFCTSCFTGVYPVSIGEHAETVAKVRFK